MEVAKSPGLSTKAIVNGKNKVGFVENKKVVKPGGDAAGNTRKDLEEKTGKKVALKENYLRLTEKAKKRLK